MDIKARREKWTPELDKENSSAVWAHTVPFIGWLLMMIGDPSGIHYAIQTFGGIALLLFFRPWRWYEKPKLKSLPLAVIAGITVFILWVGFESVLFKNAFLAVSEFYERWFVDFLRIGKLREPMEIGANGLHYYDPKTTGWLLFWIHMVGTTIVIGAIEEFMFRGFIYRWAQRTPFFKVNIGRWELSTCLMVSAVFALEHREWLMGFLCGIIYTFVMVRTRDIWAAIFAHALTNGLLGLYAVHTGAYYFW